MDRVIGSLAARQNGLVARRQLIALGVGRRAIGHRLERRRLLTVQRGVYAVGHFPESVEARAMAAVLLGGEGAVLSHLSAAWLWRLRSLSGPFVEVTVRRRREARSGVGFHHAALPPDEVTRHEGIPVTTVPRTVLDLAGVLRRRELERALNEAEVRRLSDPLSVPDLLARHPRARGAATLRAILTDARLGEGITRSELEERFLTLLDRAGVERPQVNVPIHVSGRWIEVDCVWPDRRLIVELDGRAAHGTRRAFERDRARDRALQADGWRVIRVTWKQLHEHPEAVIADLARLLRG